MNQANQTPTKDITPEINTYIKDLQAKADATGVEYKFEVEFKKKYAKIIVDGYGQHHVHSFVVVGQDDKFPVGTILKPKTWGSPTRNLGRGNVTGKYNLNVYGV